jgi:siroheme synthase
MKRVTVQQDPAKIVEPLVLAHAIVDIGKAMQRLATSGLNRKAVVLLVSHDSKVSQRDVIYVLDSLEHLAKTYCK